MPMTEARKLTEREITEINKLMERKSEIVLEPRKDGYFIYESKKKLIMRPEKQTTTTE
ncbi:MAG: hypothetical protein J6A37_12265 [Oscillospiraceae bacterium]|nr:hypothetical protein [Oscillospiraceae bacterium]